MNPEQLAFILQMKKNVKFQPRGFKEKNTGENYQLFYRLTIAEQMPEYSRGMTRSAA